MKTFITSLFGLSQRKMAMVLGIGYSQWSMYECGKRNLPTHATKLLAEMLTHMKSAETSSKKEKNSTIELVVQAKIVDELLKENRYQQLAFTRKIKSIKKKLSTDTKLSHLADFVAKRNAEQKITGSKPMRLLRKKTPNSSGSELLESLIAFEIKKDLLQVEKMHLESKYKNLTATPENPDPKPKKEN